MDKLGALVKVFMKSGLIFQGCINKYEDTSIVLKTMNGDIIDILLPEEIVAIQYTITKDEIVKERNVQDETPKHKPGDVDSLLALRKAKAEEELKDIKAKLHSNTYSMEPTTYESQLSALLRIEKHQ
jgi:hypothetical protein